MAKSQESAQSHELWNNHEPIAIIGMGCQFPGGVSSPSQLWDLLEQSRSGHTNIPTSRFNADGFYHPDRDRPGSINATGGYFLDGDPRLFENSFFGINNLEATYMDPQQRKLLEIVYECIESAGYSLENLSGANIGCYVASFTLDFRQMQSQDSENFHRYSATGMGATILANRISHVFNLHGPSFTLDTACSSSIYCLHLACAALDANECDSAIVAGANLILSPEIHLGATKAGILSDTSTCHSFDVSADGYGRAEGVGALYLKKLGAAIRDGDPIRSIIRGTAVNSNGKTNGISLPSADGQEAVIRKAYAKAKILTNETDYVESHTTGTPVGDPIEVDAISRVLRHKTGRATLVGTVKSNLGHSEAASGICSVIKVTLALEKDLIPPGAIGITELNPDLKLKERNVEVVTKRTQWPSTSLKRASINSFGYGGANAHAILEAAESHTPPGYNLNRVRRGIYRTFLVPLSAHSQTSLMRRTEDMSAMNLQDTDIADLAYTLGQRRTHLPVRGFFLAQQDTLKVDMAPSNLKKLPKTTSDGPRLPIAFVLTGQGAQWPQMGKELLELFPTYRKVVEDLDDHLASLENAPSWSLKDSILEPPKTSAVHTALYSQTVCTATQLGLISLLKEWKVNPTAVIGHSSGEIAAAFAAGHITANEAITIAYYRGLVVSMSSLRGEMIAVGINETSASLEISKLGIQGRARVACINSQESVTMSGDSDAIQKLLEEFQNQGVFARTLKTDGMAYHSHHMSLVGQAYQDLLSKHLYAKRKLTVESSTQMYSSVTGDLIHAGATRTPDYWRTNLESPVQFQHGLEFLLLDKKCHLIEIGPHSALQLPIKQIAQTLKLTDSQMRYSSSLIRGKDSLKSILELAGTLFLHGHGIAFEKVNFISFENGRYGRVMHELPKYQWDYGPLLWDEPRRSSEFRNRANPRHELLGSLIPGGSGELQYWRNVLDVKDVPWLEDHQLNKDIVFPAAGYVAMAIEALSQVQAENFANCQSLVLRHVRLLNALILNATARVEVFTQFKKVPLSGTSISNSWWYFEVSSFSNGCSIVHGNGEISFGGPGSGMKRNIKLNDVDMQQQHSRKPWYDKLSTEGFYFGPAFQSMATISTPKLCDLQQAGAEVLLQNGRKSEQVYTVHPIIIDALLQTVLIATASGSTKSLHAKVPFSIEEIMIARTPVQPGEKGYVQATSEVVSFGTITFDAELCSHDGKVLVQMSGGRAVANQGGLKLAIHNEERTPMLRIIWKPEFACFSPGRNDTLASYLDEFTRGWSEGFMNADTARLAGTLDLLAHNNPNLRILELGGLTKRTTDSLLNILDANTRSKRFRSYTQGQIDDAGEIQLLKIQSSPFNEVEELKSSRMFDIIFFPELDGNESKLEMHFEQILKYSAPSSKLVFGTSFGCATQLKLPGFDKISAEGTGWKNTIIIAQRIPVSNGTNAEVHFDGSPSAQFLIVERQGDHGFSDILELKLTQVSGKAPKRVFLEDISSITVPPGSIVLSTIEISTPLFDNINPSELDYVKVLTDNAAIILWVTGGSLFKAEKPVFSIVNGISRTVMLEQPKTKFFVVDIDDPTTPRESTTDHVLWVLKQAMRNSKPQFEYLCHKGILYTSRFQYEQSLNQSFQNRQHSETVKMPWHEAGHCSLAIESPGLTDTIYFAQHSPKKSFPSDSIEVQTMCVGLNSKDIFVLGGKVDTKDATCALEFSGIVSRVGSAVRDFAAGDRVVAVAPNKFSSYQVVPGWACCKLNEDEDFETLSTVPVVFMTAIHALKNLARLQRGESVLIHAAAGGVGIAAIYLARLIGAEIFATVGADSKKQFLVDTFNLKAENIFSSRDSSFLPGILAATSGRGVDVVLNSLTKDQLHDSFSICAEFGRFVEIGKRDILDGGKLSMDNFRRSLTFTAFDLSSYYNSDRKIHHDIWTGLLQESIQLLRAGKIKPVSPLKVFDVSEISQAYRYLSLRTRMGKIAVSVQNSQSLVKILPAKYRTNFSPIKCYLMIGCLGGIGRSVSKWMMLRGARKFTFLNRSGIERENARQLVDELKLAGAEVKVVQGDISVMSDVEKAFAELSSPIGGIVQAAMSLQESLWTSMTSQAWHKSLDPKVKGTWNLQQALQGNESQLEFFLLLSSMCGSLGTATEANYCAANCFQDAFARYRRSAGLPATAIGLGIISGVGYLHENPEVEKLLRRRDIQSINEEELLEICDLALSNQEQKSCPGGDHFVESHMLTGLETQGMVKMSKEDFDASNHVLKDPRAEVLANALFDAYEKAVTEDSMASHEENNGDQMTSITAYLKPGGVRCASPMDSTLLESIQFILAKKMCTLLLLSIDQLRPHTPLGTFGMDSMLAADFRHFVFHTFYVDIPFLMLLAPSTTVASLSEFIALQLWTDAGH